MHYKSFTKILVGFLFSLFIYGCTEEDTTEPTDENTILYSSFEENGKFSVDGWFLPLSIDSSNDVPPNGGSYSLGLSASAPELYAKIVVPAKTLYSEYKFTFWAKSTAVTTNIYGKAILSLIRNGMVIKSLSVLADDIIWKSYSIQDTFSVAAGDSFMVQLTAGIHQLLPAKTYFDLCRLYGID